MVVHVNGKQVVLNPARAVGKGGEADIYDIGGGLALKLFKTPDHADFQGLPLEQQAARERIAQHQKKLPAFPRTLPGRVVIPRELALDGASGAIAGYTMQYLKNCRSLRHLASPGALRTLPDRGEVVEVLKDLHHTVKALHRSGVIIGDFNDLNVLVDGARAWLIDADSFQFGGFLCTVFTTRFVDPALCVPANGGFMLAAPYTEHSDWYAYAVMVMSSLLFVDPYGGVYAPGDPSLRMPHEARPLKRITVFHPDVRYPRSALPCDVLPDELLHWLHLVFTLDTRGEFPLPLLERLDWRECPACGLAYARSSCPRCAHTPQDARRQVAVVHGDIIATTVFSTRGVILSAAVIDGALRWVCSEGSSLRREDGQALSAAHAPETEYAILGAATVAAREGALHLHTPGAPDTRIAVDTYEGAPAFACNGADLFWLAQGALMRRGPLAPEHVGDALEGRTWFRVGPRFGFGFFRAGQICRAFVFDARRRGINDSVHLPALRNPIVDADCFFTDERCWLLLATQEQGRTVHRCIVVRRDGAVEASAEGAAGDGTWLGTLHGKCAAGNFLLCPTDDGLVRVEAAGNALVKAREFPDTRSLIDETTRLYPGKGGLYAVGRREVTFLKLR